MIQIFGVLFVVVGMVFVVIGGPSPRAADHELLKAITDERAAYQRHVKASDDMIAAQERELVALRKTVELLKGRVTS